MFGSSFSFGFALSNIVTQIVGLLSNPVIIGLIVAGIAMSFSRHLIRFVRMVGRGGGNASFDYEDPRTVSSEWTSSDERYMRHGAGLHRRAERKANADYMRATRAPSPIVKSIDRHKRRHGSS